MVLRYGCVDQENVMANCLVVGLTAGDCKKADLIVQKCSVELGHNLRQALVRP